MTMDFFFNIKNDPAWNPGTIFFYNGAINKVQGVHNTEELKYLEICYNETHRRAIRSYVWDAKVAPVYVRVFGTLQPSSKSQEVLDELKKLEELLKK